MQRRAILDPNPIGLWIKPGLLLIALIVISGTRHVSAEEQAPRELPRRVEVQ